MYYRLDEFNMQEISINELYLLIKVDMTFLINKIC